MKRDGTVRRIGGMFLASALLAFSLPVYACTIFVLTDSSRALFFNNEDWSNPVTRIWFVPGTQGRYGAVYVGFDNGWSQGGLNSKGLAFDWVAGWNETYEPDAGAQNVHGNPSERMLESCGTVEEAIAFYQKNRETSFGRAKILVADSSGASVIVGARDGKLQVERSNQCRGFGYGHDKLEKMLATPPEPTVAMAPEFSAPACRKANTPRNIPMCSTSKLEISFSFRIRSTTAK